MSMDVVKDYDSVGVVYWSVFRECKCDNSKRQIFVNQSNCECENWNHFSFSIDLKQPVYVNIERN